MATALASAAAYTASLSGGAGSGFATIYVVGEDIDYSYCASGGETLIVAEALREAVFRDIEHEVVKTVKGSELVGLRYEQLFDYLEVDAPNAFQVLPADFVSTEDGTGIVHTAPAYGVDDLAFGQQHLAEQVAGGPVVRVEVDGALESLDLIRDALSGAPGDRPERARAR